tara:strand:+ start:2458 stop:4992 length:2535 start_codon:yes stop_codon:yes gene_type:complete
MELTITQALGKGISAHRAGNLQEAERIYKAILQSQPNLPDANHNLGVLAVSVGKVEAAIPLFKKAVESNPKIEQFWLSYIDALIKLAQIDNAREVLQHGKANGLSGDKVTSLEERLAGTSKGNTSLKRNKDQLIALYAQGKFHEAIEKGKSLLTQFPDDLTVLSILAGSNLSQEKYGVAVEYYNTVIDLKPEAAEFYLNCGVALGNLSKPNNSLTYLRKSIILKPSLGEAFYNIGTISSDNQQNENAIGYYKRALIVKPNYWSSFYNIANAYKEVGETHSAIENYRSAIRYKPDHFNAYNNLGIAISSIGNHVESLWYFQRAILLKPDYTDAYSNLGNMQKRAGNYKQSIIKYKQAIRCKVDFAQALNNLGDVLRVLGQSTIATKFLKKAAIISPDYAEAYNNLGNALVDLGKHEMAGIFYDHAIGIKPNYAGAYNNKNCVLNYYSWDAENKTREAIRFGQTFSRHRKKHFPSYECTNNEKIRIGFVSGDLRAHPVGYFLESVLSSIDKSQFDLFAYTTDASYEDELSMRIKPLFREWRPIFCEEDEAVAELIHADGINILVDLSGHTAGNRLPVFVYKPAPVQVTWLGYFSTTGLSEIDYLIGDPYVTPPENDDQFSEKVLRLPETRWCFTAPDIDAVVSELPAQKNGYITFGCFNNLSKITNEVLEVWAEILNKVGNSQLFLKAKQLNNDEGKVSTLKRFLSKGIKSERITLEGWSTRAQYLASYNNVDIVLDPFPFTGGTTSVEGLWMGVPFVTLAGNCLVSRQGVGLLSNVNLPNWIANCKDDYVKKTVQFTYDLDYLSNLRSELRVNVLKSPLFEAERFADNLGNAVQTMWNNYQNKQT